MLLQLTVRNYTIIRQLAVRFGEGFSVITGETGAGKSVLTDAIAFVLGQRADTSVLFDKSQKSYVEAIFRIEDSSLSAFFTENDLDFEEVCILRREITPQGKSRNFINDTPVPLSTLRQLSERLIDIHSQHANLLLRKKQFQLQLIDRYGHLQPALENCRASSNGCRPKTTRRTSTIFRFFITNWKAHIFPKGNSSPWKMNGSS